MVEFIVLRHGETVENSQRICQGQTEGTLSERGWQQVK
ncbi:MAG TPA: histidine phosphatase family protein, partial [Tenuifilaceae bacterium]|nr:histidine phosphatase family protein [Tenuifilaceae bacterium]